MSLNAFTSLNDFEKEIYYQRMDIELKSQYLNLVKGAIFGQAIGDALGHPIEFEKTHVVVDLEDDNKFTDDTQMFCAIGEALLEAPPHKGIEPFMEALTKHFVEWRRNPLGGSHRAPGGTCMEGVRRLGAGHSWRQSGKVRDGKGNGTAMRSGIVGARYWQDPVTAFRIGCLTSVNTHNNLESILAAGMVAYLVARSIQGADWTEAVAEGIRLCAEFETQVPEYPTNHLPMDNTRDGQSPWGAIASFSRGYILGESNMLVKQFLAENGNDFTAVPAVSEAIYFNTRNDSFDEMVIECANASDDSDTITAITGCIAGARFGYSEINARYSDMRRPSGWVDRIEMREYLEDLSNRIFEASLGEGDLAEARDAQALDNALGEDFVEGEEFQYPGEPPLENELTETANDIADDEFEVEF